MTRNDPESLNRRRESGFTLIELLIVLVTIGILLSIAVPSYLGFRTRAHSAVAKANVRSTMASAAAFYADNKTFVGMTNAKLRASYNVGIPTTVTLSLLTATSYRLTQVRGGCTARVTGPGGSVTVTGTGCT